MMLSKKKPVKSQKLTTFLNSHTLGEALPTNPNINQKPSSPTSRSCGVCDLLSTTLAAYRDLVLCSYNMIGDLETKVQALTKGKQPK